MELAGTDDDAPKPPPAVTIFEMVSMVFRETPARVKSATEVYGLPATIRFAVAAPTPGSVCRSLGLAVFKSMGGSSTRLAGFFTATPDTAATTRRAQARSLAKYAGVAQRVAARLRIDAESMGAFADGHLCEKPASVSIDRIYFLAVPAGEPENLAVSRNAAHIGTATTGNFPLLDDLAGGKIEH